MGKKKFIYKGFAYEKQTFLDDINLSKTRYIIILDEDIYVKRTSVNYKEISNDKIEKIKEESFGKDEEYLIDYNFNKKEDVLYIYAIKGGKVVSKLCNGANKIKVVPLQFYVMQKLRKKIRDKIYVCGFKYMEKYYYYYFNNGFVEESYVFKDLEDMIKKINIIENKCVLYIEKGIDYRKFVYKIKIQELELRRILNEKVFI
ncbi:hypothetical protein [Clostridium sp. SHJSY1]|uniref:hypothetical protein n=1 Tax=Clostridium sp. SHJSY1 TaxID=2942483 RepID=UPI00287BC4B1|nr:hypothetical protein [Clostridium sp. SHJSY1]